MYRNIIQNLEDLRKDIEDRNGSFHNLSNEEARYMSEGTKVSRQIVEQENELDSDELLYDTLSRTLEVANQAMSKEDLDKTIKDIQNLIDG